MVARMTRIMADFRGSRKKSAFICFNPRHPRIYSNLPLACLPRRKGILSFYPTLAMMKGGAGAAAKVH
ncbi:MAG: hypothetical protein KDE56_24315 [Anaerolineales bacterium]|nr:hypothetical protein [Anaerolineales bacterium]